MSEDDEEDVCVCIYSIYLVHSLSLFLSMEGGVVVVVVGRGHSFLHPLYSSSCLYPLAMTSLGRKEEGDGARRDTAYTYTKGLA